MTDPRYRGMEYYENWREIVAAPGTLNACRTCGALVTDNDISVHRGWHYDLKDARKPNAPNWEITDDRR